MRTLTSIQSATNIQLSKNFIVEPTSQTAFSFNDNDIVSISAVTWQNTIKGGISIPSNYQVTLSSSLGFIKSKLEKFVDQKTILQITVNSDTFTPHIGKVESIRRNGSDPNTITLNIYDTSLSSSKKFPVHSIVDSYDTLPKVADNDFGYPAYYGRQIRPFYFYPLDQDAQDFIGPVNVSGAVRQESCYYMKETGLDIDLDSNNVFLLKGSWNQESGDNNQINMSNPFEVSGFGSSQTKIWNFTSNPTNLNQSQQAITDVSTTILSQTGNGNNGFINSFMSYSTFYDDFAPSNVGAIPDFFIEYEYGLESQNTNIIRSANTVNFTAHHNPSGGIFQVETLSMLYRFYVVSGDNIDVASFASVDIDQDSNEVFTHSGTLSEDASKILTKDYSSYMSGIYVEFDPDNATTVENLRISVQTSMSLDVSLFPEAYNNYSVFITETNCTNIAVSENPMGILADLFDQTSVEYVASQNSFTQFLLDARGYQFQCLFDKRTDVYEIAKDFGEASRTNMWVADSGMINFYFYQNSDQAATDLTLTLDDMFKFDIVNNPISTTAYGAKRAKRFDINYDYSFHKDVFQKTVTANPNNNTFCQSADAAGIDKEIAVRTPYILDTDTASKYLGHLVAFNTLSSEFVEMNLPARFFQLELCDILRVQHPMIVGSESKYQVVQLSHNYDNGNVFVKAQELIEIP